MQLAAGSSRLYSLSVIEPVRRQGMATAPQFLVPSSYTPIDACVAGAGVSLETGLPSIYPSCRCSSVCTDDCSCTIIYSQTGTLKGEYLLENAPPLFECNAQCTCSESCRNRVSQRGLRLHLRVDQTEHKGLGVFTEKCIPTGGFIGEYVGEVISSAWAEEKLRLLDEAAPCFILTFKEHMPNGSVLTTNVDGTSKGNIVRFVNHSCSPNAVLLPVRTNSILPRLCLYAAREISAGEELCFSYFGTAATTPTVKLGKKPCFCGTTECAGFLPKDA